MGNSKSVSTREELGERIFQHAKVILYDRVDDSQLEKITGMVLDSSDNLNDLQLLFDDDTQEIERRIKLSASLVKKQSNIGKNCSQIASFKDVSKERNDNKRQELIKLFERLYPSADSLVVTNELLNLSDKERNYIISTPNELKNFINSCSSNKYSRVSQAKSATTYKLEPTELLNKLKLCPEPPSTEISDNDVEGLIGDHLFQVVSQLHPSFASRITGILMQLDKDMVLHLLASTSSLHKKIAVILNELDKKGELNSRDLAMLRDDLGNVIYALLEKETNADAASHVTGMLLEMNIPDLHELLADEIAFRDTISIALNAVEKRS